MNKSIIVATSIVGGVLLLMVTLAFQVPAPQPRALTLAEKSEVYAEQVCTEKFARDGELWTACVDQQRAFSRAFLPKGTFK